MTRVWHMAHARLPTSGAPALRTTQRAYGMMPSAVSGTPTSAYQAGSLTCRAETGPL